MRPLVITFLLLSISLMGNAQKPDSRSVFADQNHLTFYLLDVENGLSNNYINHIEQDSLGFIWIATIDGLNRYDGHDFHIYRKSNLNPHTGPAANYIEHLEIGEDQKLLLATYKGVSEYDPKVDSFSHFKGSAQNSISYIINHQNDRQIIANYEGGVAITKGDSVVAFFLHSPKDPNSLSSSRISSLSLQGDSVLWVGHFDKGLDKIELKTKTVKTIAHTNPTFPETINSLYTDETGNLWVGSNDGIRIITTNADTLQIKAAELPQEGLSDGNVLCFEKDPAGNLWIGTRNGGLNILNSSQFLKNQTLQLKWFLPEQDGSSVFNRTVSSLKLADDGRMWIGTSTGLNFVNPSGDPVKLVTRNLSKEQTISHDRIGSIAESKDGSIWIGTDGGGLDHYFPQTERIQHFEHDPGDPQSLSNNYIISLLEDSKRNLWVGTYQGGLNLLNTSTGSSKHYLQESQEKGNDVRVIFEGKNGQIWVGTNRGGLYRYHPPIDNFDYVKLLGKIDIRDIAEDELGNLWLATYGDGIIRYNYLTGEQELFNEKTIPGFPVEVVFAIEILDNGDVLAGSRYEGLIRLNPQSKTFTLFTDENGLSNNSINSLAKGKDGKIWLGTYRGISYFNPKTNTVGNLNSINNIQLSEFNIGASLVTASGDVYLGGNKGINVFNPETLENESVSYPLIFTDLRLMNKKVTVNSNAGDFHLEYSLPYLNQLNLTHKQSLISLDFVALKFPLGKDIDYAYKLEPFHSQWIETNQTGTVNLSNIPPGNYTLKVKAISGTTAISENQLDIIISPPFWKTWPAYLLYFILIVTITGAGMRYYAERLKLKNSLLFEKKQRILEHELNEERVQFFTGFSHELKTPLTLILAPLDDLLLEIKNSKQLKGLKLIQKNAKYLHEMISKLLEFRNAELNVNELNLKSQPIVKPIKQWVEQYQPLAKHKGIKLKSQLPKADFIAEVDLQKLHIIFNNLVSNALKYCREKDQIIVSLEEKESDFELVVSDNGPGIAYEDQSRIFNWYYQSGENAKEQGDGIGLALTKRLVEDHRGKIDVISDPGNGCTFSILIPKKANALKAFLPESLRSEEWMPELDHAQPESTVNFDLKETKEVLLIIDDNPQILEYLNNSLSGDYDLIFAKNGQEGFEKAIQFIPDLIISDVMMPEKNGIDLCGILKENHGTTHIPVILLSAKDSTDSITSGFGKGADDYITKPFKGEILKSRIRNLLDAKIRMRSYYLGKSTQTAELTSSEKSAISKEKSFLKELEGHILAGISLQTTDVDTISQAMGMSRTSLFRKLKALTGQNINQYIRTIKVVKAASLIKEENLGVAQAAYEVGFTSTKHFRKLFKEQFGYLPSEVNEAEKE
ncbi:signal transduction histidine kinase/ligand-binding sensor domain-containing protein/CheY-like chemotaxis protein [Algoriphagus sp. 4150]|uniref:hybrid sensor histidine kinase/response regulator transcription factor n=1 Tax=Algoriphagus sp. 4150 TaxID=2817756 RepID=UPI00285BD530|nr:two-component regulator propeller domain-containing protein [Algoriphagus sp. 4150]MDR7130347.1 signal transduction histidine kinase/ligand-binding sensor domain-containing protein/CheY-like chemotaxis protein [Algoriphagus sp. 4150]